MKGLPVTSTSVLVLSAIFLYICTSANNNALVNAAAIHQNSENAALNHVTEAQEENEEEEQLQKLKAFPANVAVSKTQTKTVTKVNGKTEMHRTKEETVEDTASGQTLSKISQHLIQTSDAGDGQPKTVLKTEVDIPSKGIHEVTVSKKPKKLQLKQQQQQQQKQRPSEGSSLDGLGSDPAEDYYLPYDGVQYSPRDMAEYIRRTGDDEGVALAVEELMREGLMGRNDAANYLEEVKNELDFMQQDQFVKNNMAEIEERNARTSGQQLTTRHQSLYLQPHQRESGNHDEHRSTLTSSLLQRPQQHPAPSGVDTRHEAAAPSNANGGQTASYNSLLMTKRTLGRGVKEEGQSSEEEGISKPRGHVGESQEEANYGDLLERLRIADFLYKEYSLEEVIYQLAKEMFTQSIVKGNRDAEESLKRFSNFLQEETNEGRISKELETKILDVVMTALMVAVGGHPSATDQPKGAIDAVNRLRDIGAIGIVAKQERNSDANNAKNRVEKQDKNAQNKEQISYDKNNKMRETKV